MCVCVYTDKYMYILFKFLRMIYIYMHIYIYIYIYILTRISAYPTRIYLYKTYVLMCAYIYIYIQMCTHTHTRANNTKVQILYVLINKKWKNSALNCEAYSSFEGVSNDHRIVTAKIWLRPTKKRQTNSDHQTL